jgi:glutamine synthetase
MKPTQQHIDVMIVDMQGNLRGKWIPIEHIKKVEEGQVRLPVSTHVQDIWGDDNDELTGMGPVEGDPDGLCIPALHTLKNVPWSEGSKQVLCSTTDIRGQPMFCDPRAVLANVIEKFLARGLKPVVALELEFYLLDAQSRTNGIPIPPEQLKIAGDIKPFQVYDIRVMDRVESTLNLIHEYAHALDIPAQASLSEIGPGQFEINLQHRDNVLQAADDAALFKRVVDRAALASNMNCTFMAKPYTESCGSGLHVHISLLDDQQNNVFDQNHNDNNLLFAVNGLLESMKDSQALLAPHANSYKRLQADSFAPVQLSWGYDHRGVAVRLPETRGEAARLEHRVAGADANPYLVLTAILTGILEGLDKATLPSSSALQAGETSTAEYLHHDWLTAVQQFEHSQFIKNAVGARYQRVFAKVKSHEALTTNKTVGQLDWQTYLSRL